MTAPCPCGIASHNCPEHGCTLDCRGPRCIHPNRRSNHPDPPDGAVTVLLHSFNKATGRCRCGGGPYVTAEWVAHYRAQAMPHVTVTARIGMALVVCSSCSTTMSVGQFVEAVAGGWDMQHTFQRPEFNDNHVIACRGIFDLRRTDAEVGS